MKIDPKYKLRNVAGETIIVQQGQGGADLTNIISLNASARLLYETLVERDFTTEDAARVLQDTYGIDEALALKDAAVWVQSLTDCHIIIL